jgi:hypothetical protein
VRKSSSNDDDVADEKLPSSNSSKESLVGFYQRKKKKKLTTAVTTTTWWWWMMMMNDEWWWWSDLHIPKAIGPLLARQQFVCVNTDPGMHWEYRLDTMIPSKSPLEMMMTIPVVAVAVAQHNPYRSNHPKVRWKRSGMQHWKKKRTQEDRCSPLWSDDDQKDAEDEILSNNTHAEDTSERVNKSMLSNVELEHAKIATVTTNCLVGDAN